MGTYTELYLEDYPILTTVSYVDPEVMTLFTESDKRVFMRKVGDRNSLVWGVITENPDEIETVHHYQSSVQNAIDRLEIMGYTMNFARDDFNMAVKNKQQIIIEMLNYEPLDEYQEELSFLQDVSINDFIEGFRDIRSKKVPNSPSTVIDEFKLTRAGKYLLEGNKGWMLNFPCDDTRTYIRILLESCSPESSIIQDITDVTVAGYYDIEDEVRNDSIEILLSGAATNSKIIVLTEGSSDKTILERSLNLPYPHLADYYRFMDFGLANSSGGASSLVSQVKGFIGVGIENKIVALLDNDTAAYVATKPLDKISIPHNVRILHYPTLSLAESYPTIGPTGVQKVNINGLAGSIELYLGEDVLKEGGKYSLVEWRGFDKSLNKYQGELSNKSEIQKRFYYKIEECEKDRSKLSNYDWTGIHLILNSLLTAFNKQ